MKIKIIKGTKPDTFILEIYGGNPLLTHFFTIGIFHIKSIQKQIEKILKRTPIKIASRKGKARELQKWVANKVSEITGIPCGKDQLIESREMGQSGVDVKLIGKAKEIFPFSIECKAQEKLNLYDAIKQAITNQREGTTWLLFSKKKNTKPIITMDAQEFFNIYSHLIEKNIHD